MYINEMHIGAVSSFFFLFKFDSGYLFSKSFY